MLARMDVHIRPAGAPDAPAIAPLLAELGYPAADDRVRERIARLAADDRAHVLVAEHAGRIVGVATLVRFPSITAEADVAWITSFVVASSERGRGVGRELVAALEALARSHDCVRISVTSAEHRDGAHAFYQRLGYDYTGRRFAKKL